MRKYSNIVMWIGVIGIVALIVRMETKHNKQEELFERVDSALVKADSALCCVEENIRVTDSLTNVLRGYNQNQAIRTDSIFKGK